MPSAGPHLNCSPRPFRCSQCLRARRAGKMWTVMRTWSLGTALAALLALGDCAQIIANRDAKDTVQNALACISAARASPDGQLVYARLWRNDGSDTADKLSDPKPLTREERDALVRVHTQLVPCRQFIIEHDNRYAAWETPYWQDLYQRSDEIYVRLAAGEMAIGIANRLSIESHGKFQSDVARGHADAVRIEEAKQQRAAEAMLQASTVLLASQQRSQVTTTNCKWMGNSVNCTGIQH